MCIKILIDVKHETYVTEIEVKGKTFPIKELLKVCKFKWNSNKKIWSYVNYGDDEDDYEVREILRKVFNIEPAILGLYDYEKILFEALKILGFKIEKKKTLWSHDVPELTITRYVAEIDIDEKILEEKVKDLAEKIKNVRREAKRRIFRELSI